MLLFFYFSFCLFIFLILFYKNGKNGSYFWLVRMGFFLESNGGEGRKGNRKKGEGEKGVNKDKIYVGRCMNIKIRFILYVLFCMNFIY